MKKDLPIVCFCVIFYKGRILLLKRAPNDSSFPNTWWLPGGHVEEGETLEQGVIREVFEEADIKLTPSQVSLITKDTSAKGKPLFLFVAETCSPLVALKDGEHVDFAWVAPCDLLQYNQTPIFIHYMQEALMFQSSQYGLTSLSSPGSIYSEAVITPSTGPVIKRGVVSDRSKVNPYSAPIVYRKNCATCAGDGYAGSDCGCPSEKANPYGMLYVPARKKATIFGSPVSFFTEASTSMKVVYGLALAALLFSTYKAVGSVNDLVDPNLS